MDIIVTIPMKYDFQHKIELEDKGYTLYWFIGKRPKDTESGDYIYFLQDGAIRWKAIIHQVWKDEVDFTNVMNVRPTIPMKGFRGFRYYREDH